MRRCFDYSQNSLFGLDFTSSESEGDTSSDTASDSESGSVSSDEDGCSTRSGSFDVSPPVCRRHRHRHGHGDKTQQQQQQQHKALTRQYSFEEDLSNAASSPSFSPTGCVAAAGHTVVTLLVPNVKPRSSSMDGCMGGGGIGSSTMDLLSVPGGGGKQQRSTSVDISLPTADDNHYQALHSK